MKKMLAFVTLACQFASVYASEPVINHLREFKLTDLPKQYQQAKPGSYSSYLQSHHDGQVHRAKSNLIQDLNLILTNNALDFALADPSYYIISKTRYTNEIIYSRLGMLMFDSNGYLITTQGFYVMGEGNNPVSPIILPSNVLPPHETTTIVLSGNLQHNSPVSTFREAVVNSVGQDYVVQIKIAPVSPNNYSVTIAADANDDVYAQGTLSFDKQGRFLKLEGLDNVTIPSADGGSEPIHIDIQADKVTHIEAATSITIFEDGYKAGELVDAFIREDGMFGVAYSNAIYVEVASIYTTKTNGANLEPYQPYYRVWTNKNSPRTLPDRYYGVRFITGFLDKDELPPQQTT